MKHLSQAEQQLYSGGFRVWKRAALRSSRTDDRTAFMGLNLAVMNNV